ncbi:hypothetical protein P8S55_06055 [Halomonas sp. M1]|uniref:hypothetical protein n=1 Tax=unclassified Halomonas TaxID=2609666 RepID=UPI00023A41F7|nr:MULTISPECIES: hypothetical protein [unclassified Halomonas]AVI62728.1 hypothetical protein BB497_08420 [Halomonas sp. GFAJ-1]EHK60957.1 hypothetical protein MOY_08973 [Halomonas sp. GFAJ-1]WFE72649.1 hypothetical protein P8S55_06055 [Halomonas sp. M1]
MHKTLGGISIVLVSALLLAGCGGQEEEQTEVQPEAVSEEAAPQQPEEVVEAVEPLEVAISTKASLRTDRRLMVEGETNLPDGAQVQVTIEREISRVRWQSRTSVMDGQFGAGPFGSGSGLPDGGYIVRVQLSEASVQPREVQARIGAQGEHLTGELVSQSRHGLGQVATYSRRFLVGSEPRRTRDQVIIVEEN